MNNYLLSNYKLSKREVLQSLFLSEYGFRHLDQAKTQKKYRWGHRLIALIDFCPFVGHGATLVEALLAKKKKSHSSLTSKTPPKPLPFKPWVFKGSQDGCTGDVPIAKVEAVRERLNHSNVLGIHFNSAKVDGYIKDGTCTAMSLEFVDSYFKIKKACVQRPDYTSALLVERIAQIGAKFSASSEEMRIRQAAFNTIEVRKVDHEIDYSRNKVQSMANLHSLKIDYASKEIDFYHTSAAAIGSEVNALPEGVFLIRIIKPANNEKLEECGHTLTYIKENGIGLLYDPNNGVKRLSDSEHLDSLFERFTYCLNQFKTNNARFYRLHEI